MTKPVTIPNTFATATTAIPLSQLDSDFSTVATALNDANTYSNYAADTGVANAYVVTLSGVSTTYSAGLRIQFKAGAANTGASTLNVNGGGTKNITFQDASALSSGTIAANAIVDVMYDGTQFLLMNDPAGTVGTGDVVGPAGATDNAIVRFDGATGKLVQNSVVTIADSTGDMSGVGQLNATTVDATNIEVTNIKAKDGTAAASIADSTGVISITSNPVLSGGTASGVLYLNGSKVATSGSALTFNGTNFAVGVAASASNNYGVPLLSVESNSFTAAQIASHSNSSINGSYFGLMRSRGTNTSPTYCQTGDYIGEFSAQPLQDASSGFPYRSSGFVRFEASGNHSASSLPTDLIFGLAGSASITPSEQMRLNSTGLGIGTSSPGQKLTVAGGVASTAAISALSASTAFFDFNSGNARFAAVSGTTGTAAPILFSQYSSNGSVGRDAMTLDSSGNLGLGVTPSASNLAGFLEGGYGTFGQTTSLGTSIAGNAYYNSGWKYKLSSTATLQLQDSGGFKWHVAPSGTAGNAITFTQAMTLDASGNLGVGTTSPNIYGTSNATNVFGVQSSGANDNGLIVVSGRGTGVGGIEFGNATIRRAGVYAFDGSDLVFYTNGSNSGFTLSERVRITSGGNLLVGTTTAAGILSIEQRGSTGVGSVTSAFNHFHANTKYADFLWYGTTIGSITNTSGTAVAYNTSSDYRLKDNPQPLTGSGAFIDALKPKTWNWKADGSRGVGFIAHEVQEVSPGSVVGEKDGEQMQAMEYGSAEFIANIIAELQSLRQRVALLEGN